MAELEADVLREIYEINRDVNNDENTGGRKLFEQYFFTKNKKIPKKWDKLRKKYTISVQDLLYKHTNSCDYPGGDQLEKET